MRSIRSKITLAYIFLATAGLAAVGFLSSMEIESFLKRLLVGQLRVESDLVVSSLSGLSGRPIEEIDRFAKELAARAGCRITIIDSSGKLLLDSSVPREEIPHVENHLSRPEFQEAKRLGLGTNLRRSRTVGEEFLYVAWRIPESRQFFVGQRAAFIRLAMPLEEVQSLVAEIRFNIVLASLIALLLVLIVSALLSQRISKPLVQITRQVEEIRAGNFDTRLSISSQDEIGRLAQTVNELVDKLKGEAVQLRKLEQVRSEFLGNVSHELRTPIFALQGFLETLLDGAIDDPAVNRDFLEKAHAQALRLNTLLTDLIDISRIESGEMKMSFRYFSLREFLESVINDLRTTAEQRNVTLTLQTVPDKIEVLGDKEKLRQALNNLIENAIKYNKVTGTVTVSVTDLGDRVLITVADTGIGIAAEHLPRIFERFYRIDKERSRQAGGTGLGLSIVKHIVEAHGSKVEVSSTVGEGSSFSFTLKK
jgi:two-component system phosphate regulon sensor histidine kinase PhoR